MKLSALQGKVQKTVIEVPGEEGQPSDPVEVHYRPGALTLEVAEKMRDLATSGRQGADDALLELLEPMLVWWDIEDDVLDEHGAPTGETRNLTTLAADIKKVPITFLGMILDKLNEEARPDPLLEGTSGDSLSPEEESGGSLTGTESSVSPDTSESHPGSLSSAQ